MPTDTTEIREPLCVVLSPSKGIDPLEGNAAAKIIGSHLRKFIKDNKSIIRKDAAFSVFRITDTEYLKETSLRYDDITIFSGINTDAIEAAMDKVSATSLDITIDHSGDAIIFAWSTLRNGQKQYAAIQYR